MKAEKDIYAVNCALSVHIYFALSLLNFRHLLFFLGGWVVLIIEILVPVI